MPRAFRFRRTAIAVSAMGAALALVFLGGRTRADEPEPDAVQAAGIKLQPLASGLGSITSITNAGDSRVFLTIQTGEILIWSGGAILPTPFLDLSGVVSCCGEEGLLSVAFHPNYAANGLFYVYYTVSAGGGGDTIVIARYLDPAPGGNVYGGGAGVPLLTIDHPGQTNHNGGQLQFGPDGDLYAGTGDGGSGDDPPCNAQNDAVLLGKLIRIDVSAGTHQIWAKGLRNPFRFSFDRAAPHDLWIGDVGQSQREEIDHEPASTSGLNYGWRVMEGDLCDSAANCIPPPKACGDSSYTSPVFVYDHSGGRCAIIGGYVYRGSQIAGLAGTYLYGDLCSGDLYGFSGGASTHFSPKAGGLQTFGQDSSGELYLGTGGGDFFQILASSAQPTATPTRTFTRTPTRTPTPGRLVPIPASERRPPTKELTPRPTD